MAINNRMSTFSRASHGAENDRTGSGDDTKREMWSSMLDGVSSGKRMPEKNILVLGGSADSQQEFLESLSSASSLKRTTDRLQIKQPPIANNFALGYTYQDVLDADQEDVLARLSVYLLADPSPSFTPLLKPLINTDTIPNTLVVILLDWSQPWLWLKQLRDWIKLVRTLLVSLDASSKTKLEEVMLSWRERNRGTITLEGGGPIVPLESDFSLPLGPGEWDEALGLPLCVVCQNSDQMEILERERSWKEEDFDFILQFLRTVLLKHGASLIYTSPSVPSLLQALINASLGIQSLLKNQPLKHNVIDREKVLVPSNWDSWGKIRVLREGFDVEGVSKGWSIDIKEPPSLTGEERIDHPDGYSSNSTEMNEVHGVALRVYEETITDPGANKIPKDANVNSKVFNVRSQDPQTFLAGQLEALEHIRQVGDTSVTDLRRENAGRNATISESQPGSMRSTTDEGRVNEHIGPVQFNMGGIQVDADDMLQRLKDRQNHQTSGPETPTMSSPDGKTQNEALASFFAGLMKRGGGSTTSSPKPGF